MRRKTEEERKKKERKKKERRKEGKKERKKKTKKRKNEGTRGTPALDQLRNLGTGTTNGASLGIQLDP